MSDFFAGDKTTKGSTIASGDASTVHQFTGSVRVQGLVSSSLGISASSFVGDGSGLTNLPGGGGGSPGGSDTQIQYNNGGSFGGISALTWDDTNIKVADDTKLFFGTNSDASIEYDEDGTNRLIISGSADGIEVTGTLNVSDDIDCAGGLSTGGNNTLGGFLTTVNSLTTLINGNIELGNGSSDQLDINASFVSDLVPLTTDIYDLGTTALQWGDIYVGDDKKLYFGSNQSGSIEFTGSTNTLILSCSSGLDISSGDGMDITIAAGDEEALVLQDESGSNIITIETSEGGSDNEVHFHSITVIRDSLTFSGSDGYESAMIETDNTGDYLMISGTADGIQITGSIFADDIDAGTAASAASYIALDANNQLVLDEPAGGGGGSPGGSDTQIQYNNGGSFGGISAFTWDDTNITIADDTKLFFGTNSDASIEYDENGTNRLIISGSAAGTEITGTLGVSDDVTIDALLVMKDSIWFSGSAHDDAAIIEMTDDGNSLIISGSSDFNVGGLVISGSSVVMALLDAPMAPGLQMKDDVKLSFSHTDMNAPYIKYDSDGEYLVISGSSDGIIISGSSVTFALEDEREIILKDDNIIVWADDGPADAEIGYDSDEGALVISGSAGGSGGTIISGSHLTFAQGGALTSRVMVKDDLPLVFGAGSGLGASLIYYDSGDEQLIISGTAEGGLEIQGAGLTIGELGIATSFGTTLQLGNETSLKYGDPTGEQQGGDPLDANKGTGEVVNFGTASAALTVGALYYLNSDGGWASASAETTGSGNSSMLGIALSDGDPGAGGIQMLTRGYFNAATYLSGAFATGSVLYVCSTANGYMTASAPDESDNYVRTVGYATVGYSGSIIYFNPSNDWVEIA